MSVFEESDPDSPTHNLTADKPGRISISICALLVLFALVEPASADSKFVYTAGEVQSIKQQFPSPLGPEHDYTPPFSVDLNGDGATDIILNGGTFPGDAAGPSGPQPGLILFNNGDNTFTPAGGDVPGSENAREVVIEDYNGDGILDIYVADVGFDGQPFPGFKNQFLLGTGSGFSDASDRLPDVEAFTHGAAGADINGDGFIDIISLNTDGIAEKLSYFLINDGNANFTLDRQRLPASLNNVTSLIPSFSAELADLDNDGFPDLIIGGNTIPQSPNTRIHWNDGNGFFSDNNVTFLADADPWGNGVEILAVIEIKGIDVNGDNRIDLLLHETNQDGGQTGLSLQLFINQGNRVFKDESLARLTSQVQDPSPNRSVPGASMFADIQGDGIIDIVLLDSDDNSDEGVLFLEGTGGGFFTPITMKGLSDDPQVRFLLGTGLMISPNNFGFAEVGRPGAIPGVPREDVININYVPVVIQANTDFQINAGHSGAWFNPETSGQGQFIDVEPEKQFMFISWFTYTDTTSENPNEQRWLTAQGNYSGNKAQLDLFETLGGRFDDPQAVASTQIGEVTLSFADCGQGQMTYSIDGEGLQGEFPLQRVIPGSGNICAQRSGTTTQAVDINAGMDGAWFDPDTSGQGFFIDTHPDPEGGNFIFVSWFTFGDDTASGQRWLTAQGSFEGSIAEIDVSETTGGSFDNPQAPSTTTVGTMSLDFTDCNNAQLSYSLPANGTEGNIAITRVIPGGQTLCEELAEVEDIDNFEVF